MAKSSEISSMYAFGDFRLEVEERRLCRGDEPVPLTPKTFELLLLLVESDGRLLRKEDLRAALWPDSEVEENNLSVAVSALRKALGESESKRFIETVPKVGYRFLPQVTKSTSSEAEPAPGKSSATPTVAPQSAPNPLRWVLLGYLIALLGVGTWVLVQRRTQPKHPVGTARRLAILPFRNLRGNEADQFLALSLADAVITKLSSIRQLTVRPSYDVQRYTNQLVDLAKVAQELGVDAVLTGSFIHEEDNLRITGQLVDVKTREIVWSGGFDTKYNKLLSVQERVAQQIVAGLELTLTPSESAKLKTAQALDPTAYEYFLRGVDLYAKNEFQLASQILEKSLELAPSYAPAWANLGRAYTASASFQFGGPAMYDKAEKAFSRALSLQPDFIDARVFLANMFTDTGRVEQAVPLLRGAIRANPSHAEAHWELGYAYRFAGMLEESVAECEWARRLDPVVKRNSSTLNSYLYLSRYDQFLDSLPKNDESALIIFYRGFGEYYRQNKQDAIQNFERAFQLDGSMLQAQVGKALSLTLQHRRSEAQSILQQLENRTARRGAYDPEAVYKVGQVYAVAGDKAAALRVLKRSIQNGFFPYSYLRQDPLLASLWGEAQFSDLVATARRRHEEFKKAFFEDSKQAR